MSSFFAPNIHFHQPHVTFFAANRVLICAGLEPASQLLLSHQITDDMLNPDLSIPERIKDIIRREIDEYNIDTEHRLAVLDAFRAAFREPREITVNFAGGIRQKCWSVTRSDGDYRVVFFPRAGYFSLCVESDFGPLDIGVHGSSIGCFSSV